MILRIKHFASFCIVLIVMASCTKDAKISSEQADQFVKYFGGSDVDNAFSVVEVSDGGFALTGTMAVGDGKTKAFFIRTDKFGNEFAWSPLLLGDDISSTGYCALAIDNGFLVVGSSTVLTNNLQNKDVMVYKIGTDGSVTWQKRIGGDSDDEAFCAIQTNAGGYLIGGYTESLGKGKKDAWAIMLDSQGNEIWKQTQGGSKDDSYKSIIETDNNFILIGSTESWLIPGYDRSLFFVKIDKTSTTGDPFDFNYFAGLSIDSDIKALKDESNNLIVMRNIVNTSASVSNIELLKVNEDFHQVIWDKTISTSEENGSSLIFHNSQIVVIGNSSQSTNPKLLIKTVNADGNLISSTVNIDTPHQVVSDGFFSADNHLLITGSNIINGYSKIALLKFK